MGEVRWQLDFIVVWNLGLRFWNLVIVLNDLVD